MSTTARLAAAVLAVAVWPAPLAAAQDADADLLFNCRLAGAKRVYTVSPSRGTLFDLGAGHPAQLRADAIDAEWLQPWGDARMRHRVHIGRNDGVLRYDVDEIDADGKLLDSQVALSGTCSREKIHPRHFH